MDIIRILYNLKDINDMKKRFTEILLFVFIFSAALLAKATVNGRFVLVRSDSSKYTVKFQINTGTGTDTLGCSTIIFNYDTSSISFPVAPVGNIDYKFLNFQGGVYNSTVTRPLPNQIWINIVSLYNNQGTVAAKSPGWTDVVDLTFKVKKDTGSAGLTWQTADNNWAIYDIDNSTIWSVGNWINENSTVQTGVLTSVNKAANVPGKFTLYQNYPNPFNPSTTIKYKVPSYSHVSLIVYDITGRQVRNLVNEEKPAGTYSVNFKADDLSSGMYLYRIVCGNFTQVKKMILLK